MKYECTCWNSKKHRGKILWHCVDHLLSIHLLVTSTGDFVSKLCCLWLLLNNIYVEKILVKTPLCECPIVISLSYHLSFLPSLQRSLVQSIPLPLAHSGSYIIHRVLLGKECAVTLNHVFRSKVKVIGELYEQSL